MMFGRPQCKTEKWRDKNKNVTELRRFRCHVFSSALCNKLDVTPAPTGGGQGRLSETYYIERNISYIEKQETGGGQGRLSQTSYV